VQIELNEQMVGRTVDVLVDAASRRRDTEVSGRTSTNVVVNVPGPAAWIGRTVRVRVERAGPHSVWGQPASDTSCRSSRSSGEAAHEPDRRRPEWH